MAKREYRKLIEDKCDENNKMNYDDVINLIDDIEYEVNRIKNELNNFINLTEIKEIHYIAEELSDKLY